MQKICFEFAFCYYLSMSITPSVEFCLISPIIPICFSVVVTWELLSSNTDITTYLVNQFHVEHELTYSNTSIWHINYFLSNIVIIPVS